SIHLTRELAIEPVQLFGQLFKPSGQLSFKLVSWNVAKLESTAHEVDQSARPGALDITERFGDPVSIRAREAKANEFGVWGLFIGNECCPKLVGREPCPEVLDEAYRDSERRLSAVGVPRPGMQHSERSVTSRRELWQGFLASAGEGRLQ